MDEQNTSQQEADEEQNIDEGQDADDTAELDVDDLPDDVPLEDLAGGKDGPLKSLVPDSPSDYAKKGGDIASAAGGSEAVVTEIAKEAAAEAARNASEAVFNSRLAQGLNSVFETLRNIPVIGSAIEGAVKAGALAASNGAGFFGTAAATVKGAFSGLGTGLHSAGSAIVSGLKSAGSAVVSGVQSVGASIVGGVQSGAAAVGAWATGVWGTITGTTTAAVTTGVVAVCVCFAAVSTGIYIHDQITVQRIGNYMNPCIDAVHTTFETTDGNELYFASRIYSVMTVAGASRYETAGVLGNFAAESAIDPTAIETVLNEPFHIGPMKQLLIDADFCPHSNPNFPNYGTTFPRILRLGIGLGQWTDVTPGPGGRNTNLREFADRIDMDWWSIDAQLAFMFYENRADFVNVYIGSGRNLSESTRWFMLYWEGINNGTLDKRTEEGARLLLEIERMVADRTYGESILALAGAAATEGAGEARRRALHGCIEQRTAFVNNQSIADAGALIAWRYRHQSVGNLGTELFQQVAAATNISPPWNSCDRAVATAIRWAGADDNFPAGYTGTQLSHLRASDRWLEVGRFPGVVSRDELMPGDVLIVSDTPSSGHIILYVGYEAAQRAHPGLNANIVQMSASIGTRSAGMGWLTAAGVYAGDDDRTYTVFRNVQMEEDSRYRNVLIHVRP